MKAVILAGGLGTRISEETSLKPKPMVEIGGKPVIWHIMKIYSHYGINDFIVCCGYKGYVIKEYFANYFLHMSDVTFDMQQNKMEVHQRYAEPWRVTLVDTGEDTMTGGRLKRVARYVQEEDAFCFTYGDGVSDVNITNLVEFHRAHGLHATLTATNPPGRFGALDIRADQRVTSFREKPKGDGGLINGGFFVLSPRVIDLIAGDQVIWEREPLETLAESNQLKAYTPMVEEYMAAADIFCLPSYREGFGLVLIEAGGVGLPVVASRIYGITDAVVDCETGLLHEVGNIVDLSDKIEALLTDKELRRRLGDAGRRRAVQLFQPDRLTEALARVFLDRDEFVE